MSSQRPLTPIDKVNKISPPVRKPAPTKPHPSVAGMSSSHKPSPTHLTSSADIFAAAEELGVAGGESIEWLDCPARFPPNLYENFAIIKYLNILPS